MKTDIAIVGGGLCGLAIADSLHREGADFQLFEARDRFGGRIETFETADGRVDLGPSWFWPGQFRMAALASRFGLSVFEQHAAGDLMFEDANGAVHRGMGYASMAGSFRISDGMTAIVDRLLQDLPADRLHPGKPGVSVSNSAPLRFTDGSECRARQIILALPPRIAAGILFDPALTSDHKRRLQAIPTWMAGQAKFVALYDHPFWRDAGLSGDAMSRHGPMAEIHDASGPDGGPWALFGFLGIPHATRQEIGGDLEKACIAQLARIFGPQALSPAAFKLQDWAEETWTATPLDQAPPGAHPDYGLLDDLGQLWDGRVIFSGTETSPEMGGYLEGALAAAEKALAGIKTFAGRTG